MVHDKKFVGLLSTSTIVRIMAPSDPKLRTFYRQLPGRRDGIANIVAEADTGIALWRKIFKDRYEEQIRIIFQPESLHEHFGDAMLQQPVEIDDLARATVVDLLRLLDYPSDFVPVISSRVTANADASAPPPAPRLDVVDKVALNARLSKVYVRELMEQARIV